MNYIYNSKWYLKLTQNDKVNIGELLYFIAFILLLTSAMLSTTMFNPYLSGTFKQLVRYSSVGLLLLKIFIFDRRSIKELSLIVLVEALAVVIWKVSGYSALVDDVLLIVGAKGIDLKKIVKIYLGIVVSVTIIAMIAVKFGWIEHIIYVRDGKNRYAFGSVYCTDFAAHIFYAIAAYCYLKGEKIKYYAILIFALLGGFVYYYCDARLDTICIEALALFMLIYKFMGRYRGGKHSSSKVSIWSRVWNWMLILSVPAAALISIITTMLYNPENAAMKQINKLLTNRLKYGKMGIDQYGFKIFGQHVTMSGNGGTNEAVKDYFFIDNSFVSIALRFGIIAILAICIYYVCASYRLIKNKNKLLVYLIVFIAINSIVAHHFIEIAYNPFLVCLFADLDS